MFNRFEEPNNLPDRARLKYKIAAAVGALVMAAGFSAGPSAAQSPVEIGPSVAPITSPLPETINPTIEPSPTETAIPTIEPAAAEPTPDKIGLTSQEADALSQGAPTGLRWPVMGIDTDKIEKIGLESDGALAAPKGYKNVGWYSDGEQACSSEGTLILDFHMSNKAGVTLVGPDFAQKVAENGVGSIIEIPMNNGKTCQYRIEKQATVDKFAAYGFAKLAEDWNIYDQSGDPKITLITCAGDFNRQQGTSQESTVITGVLIGQNN